MLDAEHGLGVNEWAKQRCHTGRWQGQLWRRALELARPAVDRRAGRAELCRRQDFGARSDFKSDSVRSESGLLHLLCLTSHRLWKLISVSSA